MLSDTKKEQITESLLSPSGGPENTARTAATTGRDAPDDIAPVKAADLNPKAIPAEAPKKDVSGAKETKGNNVSCSSSLNPSIHYLPLLSLRKNLSLRTKSRIVKAGL